MKENNCSNIQTFLLVFLRILIGWHLCYEGLSKLFDPGWSSESYLLGSTGFLKTIFQSMAENQDIVKIVDFLNIWGLILAGAGLILGLFTKISSIAGIGLLTLYFLSNPPMLFKNSAIPYEGNCFLVDKNLIEIVALLLMIYFPTGRIVGIDRILFRKPESK